MIENFEGPTVKNGHFFGLPVSLDSAEILILQAPWDVTTSYRDGTSAGPRAILEASYQLDFFSPYRDQAWNSRIATVPAHSVWMDQNRFWRSEAKSVIASLEDGMGFHSVSESLARINAAGAAFHAELEKCAADWLSKGKKLVIVGGDHSVSLGPIRALASRRNFSVLHIDAHADLRVSYEGFEHSHASIMHHVKEIPAVRSLVQVGLRDVSPDEASEIARNPKISAFFDWEIRRATALGESWSRQCQRIVERLEENVYLSLDIDGLDPRYCPGTGTPVPGGLEMWELFFLLEEVERSGRRFVGADLVEVAPSNGSEWDANVGARLLFQICQFLRDK